MRRVVSPFVLALLAGACLAACGAEPEPAAGPAGPAASLAVALSTAATRPIERVVVASGAIAPWEEMQLGVEVGGLRVTALHVDVGESVAKGDVLLELDHRLLDSELRQAEAAHGEAVAGVSLAQVNLGRGEALKERQLVSASSLDELRAVLVQARAREATTRAQRDGVALRRDFATLRAPDAGIISRRLVEPGQVVAAGTELLRMIRQGRLEWRAELTETDLARVRVGANVMLAHDGAVIPGVVRAVSPGLDPATRTGTIHVDLPAPGALKAGMFLEGRIVAGEAPALVVPAAAVVQRDGYAYVFTIDERNVAHRRRVRTGASDAGEVEVLEGLVAGDAVVARDAAFLGDGDVVRVVPDAAAPQPGDVAKRAR